MSNSTAGHHHRQPPVFARYRAADHAASQTDHVHQYPHLELALFGKVIRMADYFPTEQIERIIPSLKNGSGTVIR